MILYEEVNYRQVRLFQIKGEVIMRLGKTELIVHAAHYPVVRIEYQTDGLVLLCQAMSEFVDGTMRVTGDFIPG